MELLLMKFCQNILVQNWNLFLIIEWQSMLDRLYAPIAYISFYKFFFFVPLFVHWP
jgi:hypothetical protein